MKAERLSRTLTVGMGVIRSLAPVPVPTALDPVLVQGATTILLGSTNWFKARRAKRRARKAGKHGNSQGTSGQ